MITADKTIKITDFGIAKAFQGLLLKEDIISAQESSGLSIFQTKQGKRVCGTLPYMAPEQFDGYADKRSDIYSFGIVLYQMVANGKLPFMAKTQQEYEELHKSVAPPQISSSLFSAIIQRCLEKQPDKRYQNFALIREKLQDFLFRETGGENNFTPKTRTRCARNKF
jgi:serine/threonine protein kinase